jgi:hypothetical protein
MAALRPPLDSRSPSGRAAGIGATALGALVAVGVATLFLVLIGAYRADRLAPPACDRGPRQTGKHSGNRGDPLLVAGCERAPAPGRTRRVDPGRLSPRRPEPQQPQPCHTSRNELEMRLGASRRRPRQRGIRRGRPGHNLNRSASTENPRIFESIRFTRQRHDRRRSSPGRQAPLPPGQRLPGRPVTDADATARSVNTPARVLDRAVPDIFTGVEAIPAANRLPTLLLANRAPGRLLAAPRRMEGSLNGQGVLPPGAGPRPVTM